MIDDDTIARIEAAVEVQAQTLKEGRIIPLNSVHVETILFLCSEVRRLQRALEEEGPANFPP